MRQSTEKALLVCQILAVELLLRNPQTTSYASGCCWDSRRHHQAEHGQATTHSKTVTGTYVHDLRSVMYFLLRHYTDKISNKRAAAAAAEVASLYRLVCLSRHVGGDNYCLPSMSNRGGGGTGVPRNGCCMRVWNHILYMYRVFSAASHVSSILSIISRRPCRHAAE